MANEKSKERAAEVLRYVADNIDRFIPEEWLLEGSRLIVEIPDHSELPTVELSGIMPAEPILLK